MPYRTRTLSIATSKAVTSMQKNFKCLHNSNLSILKTAIYLAPILLCSFDAYAVFDLDAFGKGLSDPTKKFVNDYWQVGVFVVGMVTAFLQREGDMRERFFGFAKGSIAAGVVVAAAKSGFGV